MTHLSDQELVDQYLITGCDQFFAQLYTRHRHRVFLKCLCFTGNTDDAEDFAQEIFVRLARKLNSYKGQSQFTTWLYAVTANYCIDQIRKQNQIKLWWGNYLNESLFIQDWGGTTDESCFQMFERVLTQLPTHHRDLLLAKYEEGTAINDIALRHDLTPSAVKMRIKRARDYARNLYDKLLAEQEQEL
ncbi:RNA polymerase sigma factor [Spirosoma aerophilum]